MEDIMYVEALLRRITVLSSADSHVRFIGLSTGEPVTGDIEPGESNTTPIDPEPIDLINQALIRADDSERRVLVLQLFAHWRKHCIEGQANSGSTALFGKNLGYSHDGKVYFRINKQLPENGEYTAVVWYLLKDGSEGSGQRMAYLMTIQGSLEVIQDYLKGMRAIQELIQKS